MDQRGISSRPASILRRVANQASEVEGDIRVNEPVGAFSCELKWSLKCLWCFSRPPLAVGFGTGVFAVGEVIGYIGSVEDVLDATYNESEGC